ncbi:hypothetical protein RN001_015806 [Aquatica leii]|uniref:Uncharacterized protein n=1 Tax=Aquatica leii TaxID=1421715 RepID=A0AAN7SAV1_9COLE|nr:hypothetical protein RN001_015806 [Aquatica leii]
MINKKSLGGVKGNSGPRRTGKIKSQKSSSISSSNEYIADSNNIFPIVRILENHLLPGYAGVLTRSAEDGVGMEDLDQLQLDLERLLSTTASRHRLLKSEMECLDQVEEKRKNKKFKLSDKQFSLKRKYIDTMDKFRIKDDKSEIRLVKSNHNFSANSLVSDLSVKREVPKVTFPRNDISEKFWLSVKPFCENVSKDDVNFLNSLIRECSEEIKIEIPGVGKHYTMDWTDDVLLYEHDVNTNQKQTNVKSVSFKKELKKSGLNAMVDTFSGPFSQRLIAALIEEKESGKANNELGTSTRSNIRTKTCMHKKLKKELEDEDIFDSTISKNTIENDKILLEIKKCTQELKSVNHRNISELRKLKSIVEKDVRRQNVKNSLKLVDEKVIKMYNRVQDAKQAQSSASDDTFCDSVSTQDEDCEVIEDEEINRLIQKQALLHKELTDLSNATFLY